MPPLRAKGPLFSLVPGTPRRFSRACRGQPSRTWLGHKGLPASPFVSLWMEQPKVALHPCQEERWFLDAVGHEPEEAAG